MKERIKVGIIGFGRMGGFYLTEMLKNPKWEVAYICDVDPEARAYARKFSPLSKVVEDEDVVFADPDVQVVGLFTLANNRLEQIQKAVRT